MIRFKPRALLVGTILYIDGRVWANDFNRQEAVDELEQMSDLPNAPLWLYVHIDPTEYHKNRRQR